MKKVLLILVMLLLMACGEKEYKILRDIPGNPNIEFRGAAVNIKTGDMFWVITLEGKWSFMELDLEDATFIEKTGIDHINIRQLKNQNVKFIKWFDKFEDIKSYADKKEIWLSDLSGADLITDPTINIIENKKEILRKVINKGNYEEKIELEKNNKNNNNSYNKISSENDKIDYWVNVVGKDKESNINTKYPGVALIINSQTEKESIYRFTYSNGYIIDKWQKFSNKELELEIEEKRIVPLIYNGKPAIDLDEEEVNQILQAIEWWEE